MSAAKNGNNIVPRAGIIGWPVDHSRSPLIHNAWLRQLDIGGYYDHCPIAPEADFRAALEAMARRGFIGANVTIPHKETAFQAMDYCDASARHLRAVNTICFRGGEIIGSNTDGAGFIASLTIAAEIAEETTNKVANKNIGWADKPVLVLGAGGAARAIVAALAEHGVPEIRLANRTRSKAEALSHLAPVGHIRIVDWVTRAPAGKDCGLLVNASSLGMRGHPPLDMPLDTLAPQALVSDIVYAPLQTPLLRAARAAGLWPVDGLGMLMHQAALSFQQWFGILPPVDNVLRHRLLADLEEA